MVIPPQVGRASWSSDLSAPPSRASSPTSTRRPSRAARSARCRTPSLTLTLTLTLPLTPTLTLTLSLTLTLTLNPNPNPNPNLNPNPNPNLNPNPIGQVHAATLPDGTQVAVKVQHPDLAFRLGLDMSLLRGLAELACWLMPTLRVEQTVAQFASNFEAQLDFRGGLPPFLSIESLLYP